jgi:hypothetical protein
MTPPNTPPRNPGADAPARRVWQPDPEKPDTNKNVLPAEGTEVRLIIEVK